MKLHEMIDQYLAASPEITGTQRSTLLRMRGEDIGKRTVPLTPKHIIDHMKWRNQNVEPATAAHDVIYLRGMLEYAGIGLGIEGVSTAPIDEAMPILKRQRLIGTSNTRTRIPSPEEHAAILARLNGINAEVVAFQYESGRRISESCRLQWGDLDAEKRTILVRDLKHPRIKSGYNKRAALPDPAFDIIQRQQRLTTAPDERIFKAEKKTVEAAYRRAVRACGFSDLHLHDSRAAIVTRLLDAGYTEPQVMLVTLHDTTRMVRSRYNRLKADDFPRRAA